MSIQHQDFDFIQQAIDYQLSSHWPDIFFNKASDLKYWQPIRTVKFNPDVAGIRSYQSIKLPKPTIPEKHDRIEDIFIYAIDAKYSHVYLRDYKILDYISAGYTQKEVGRMFGLSRRRIGQIIKKMSQELPF